MTMRDKAECIMRESIQRVMPGPAVTTALQNCKFSEGRLYLVAVGKAAWEMANSAVQCLDKKVCAGIVLTKYGHVQGSIKDVVCYEAGHPVPDENALRGTQAILRMVTGWKSGTPSFFFCLVEDPLFLKNRLFLWKNCRKHSATISLWCIHHRNQYHSQASFSGKRWSICCHV